MELPEQDLFKEFINDLQFDVSEYLDIELTSMQNEIINDATDILKENIVGEYFADILVEDKVIIELKTVERIDKIHEAQLLNYLKATGILVGMIINFKNTKAEIKRMVLNLPVGHDHE